jgi:hypothetical protein
MAGRKRKFEETRAVHYSPLNPEIEEAQHSTQKKTKFSEINQDIRWVFKNGESRAINHEEFEELVQNHNSPKDVVSQFKKSLNTSIFSFTILIVPFFSLETYILPKYLPRRSK